MDDALKNIYIAFDGKLVGTYKMKKCVCYVVAQMPQGIQDFVTANCWFISSMEDAWAFAFTGNDLKDQHLIFLSDDLLMHSTQQIYYSIAHEVGHVVLKHRNSILVKQSRQEIAKQEKEADIFARQYFEKIV